MNIPVCHFKHNVTIDCYIIYRYTVVYRRDHVVVRVCLRIVVSDTYCIVFLFCFSSSCVASFSRLSVFDDPSNIP